MAQAGPSLAEIEARLSGGTAAPSSDYDLNPGSWALLPKDRKLRPAAVLVGLLPGSNGLEVLLTRRSSALRHHPGQIAFPGGKREEADADDAATAFREAKEEVGLPGGHVLGALPTHETVTGFNVTPIIAEVEPFTPVLDRGEVEEAFQVPLAHLLDLERFHVRSRRWRGIDRHFYTVPYGPYYIWGATARMLRQLADVLG